MALLWLKARQQGYAASWIMLAGFSLGVLLVLYLPAYLFSTSISGFTASAQSTSLPAFALPAQVLPTALLSSAVVATIVLKQLRFKALYLASISATAGVVLVLFVSGITAEQQVSIDTPTDFQVTGHIASLPEVRGRKLQAVLQVDRGEVCRFQSLPCRLLLSWYRDKEGGLPELEPGQQWSLTLRAKPARNYANPGGFDYAHWLAGQGIHATAYVKSRQPYQLTGKQIGGQVNLVRQQLAEHIRDVLPASTARSLVLGLAVGVRAEIDSQTRQLLQDTGTAHLLAISGMHIGMVSGFAFVFARVVWWLLFLPLYQLAGGYTHSRMLRGLMAANRSYFTGAVALLAAFAYALAAGFSLPTQRALLMLAVFVLLRLLQRRIAMRHVLLIVLVAALLFDPLAPLYPGIWLSFGAVVALVWLGSGRVAGRVLVPEDIDQEDKELATRELSVTRLLACSLASVVSRLGAVCGKFRQHLVRAAMLQLSLSFLLFPLAIIFFQQGSVVSPLANFFAIPLVGFVVLPLVMVGVAALGLGSLAGAAGKSIFASLSGVILVSAERCLEFLLRMLEWFNQLPVAAINFPDSAIIAAVFAVLGCLCATKPRGGRLRWLALPLLMPLLVQGVTLRQDGLRVHVLDVGQGLSVVVETRGQALLYDTGIGHTDAQGEGFSLVKTVLRPFLRSQGLPGPQVAVVSHSDNDHAGGLAALRRYYPGVRVIAPAVFTELAADEVCEQGKRWSWNGVEFQLLYPGLPEAGAATLSDNDLSCVLLIRYGRSTVLLTGDIEAHAEARLIDLFRQSTPGALLRQQIDVLVAPHHGSATSSSEKFVSLLRPRFAVFSMGWANRYGFPDSSVVLRYKSVGTKVFRTDESGAVRFDFDREGMLRVPQEYRRERRRIWSLWR